MAINIPVILKLTVDLFIGSQIRKAGPDQAKKAQEVIDVCAALKEINSGDTTAGLSDLQSALTISSTDPAKEQAIYTAVAFVATKISAIKQGLDGTLLGTINTDILNSTLDEAIAIAQKYLPTHQ